MARSARIVSAAKGGVQQTGNGTFYSFQSGSMGAAPVPDDGPPLQPFESEAPDHDDWQRELLAREAAEGITEPETPFLGEDYAMPVAHIRPGPVTYVPGPSTAPADLTGIPETFGLQVERKADGTWKITAPDVHVGLFVSDRDLCAALAKAPSVLANIVRLDGVMPQPKARRKKL